MHTQRGVHEWWHGVDHGIQHNVRSMNLDYRIKNQQLMLFFSHLEPQSGY